MAKLTRSLFTPDSEDFGDSKSSRLGPWSGVRGIELRARKLADCRALGARKDKRERAREEVVSDWEWMAP